MILLTALMLGLFAFDTWMRSPNGPLKRHAREVRAREGLPVSAEDGTSTTTPFARLSRGSAIALVVIGVILVGFAVFGLTGDRDVSMVFDYASMGFGVVFFSVGMIRLFRG